MTTGYNKDLEKKSLLRKLHRSVTAVLILVTLVFLYMAFKTFNKYLP